jgi:hypothetical protein
MCRKYRVVRDSFLFGVASLFCKGQGRFTLRLSVDDGPLNSSSLGTDTRSPGCPQALKVGL